MARSLERSIARVASLGRSPASRQARSEGPSTGSVESSAPDPQQLALVEDFLESGSPPDAMDVLVDLAPPPFTLARFQRWLADQMLEENLDFYYDVGVFRLADDAELADEARRIIDMYIRSTSNTEVNLSPAMCGDTIARVEIIFDDLCDRTMTLGPAAASAPTLSVPALLRGTGLDRTVFATDPELRRLRGELRDVFAPAEAVTLQLLREDTYPRFTAALNAELKGLVSGTLPLGRHGQELLTRVALYESRERAATTFDAQSEALILLLKRRSAERKRHQRRGRERQRRHSNVLQAAV
eukprot:TRINITY_DN7789_c0_g1_i1.p1 TRINITY_DN7789_c0_g1~~TRINITY_DN7789_c0_g1_i1.p1  ORF type:complete len:299 (+),score=68.74 TRINITY_DN7789_c0_g1_i1:189-1085(+)